MTKLLLDTLVPIFAGLLLGYLAGRRGIMDNVNVKNLIVLVMTFAVPCAMFSTLIQSSRLVLQQHIATSLVITFTYFALYVISYFWARRFLRMHVSESSVLALTIGFSKRRCSSSSTADGSIWFECCGDGGSVTRDRVGHDFSSYTATPRGR